MKRLSLAEYEELCREASSGYSTSITEETLWFAICKNVYHHIYGYRRDLILPFTKGPRSEVYKSFLEQIVTKAQSEDFDALEVAGKYISSLIRK